MLGKSWWVKAYQKNEAYWLHDGNPKRPHALLTSGLHSNGFFNSQKIIPIDELMRAAAKDFHQLVIRAGVDLDEVDFVVGPQTGATRLAEVICDDIRKFTGGSCLWASPAKSEKDGAKSMVFEPLDLARLDETKVLLCEDVLTTGGSVELAAKAVEAAGGELLPYVLVLVNRSGLQEVGGREVIALIDEPMPMWTPEECPLCAQGSEAVRPKENWALLNAEY